VFVIGGIVLSMIFGINVLALAYIWLWNVHFNDGTIEGELVEAFF